MTALLALPPALVVSGDRLRDPATAARLEWFESDGRGGGAAGTVVGAATRREHGLLLVAADAPETPPYVVLARLEERIVTDGGDAFEPGVNFYPDAIHPRGDLRLRSFALDPWPAWQYDLEGATLVREVLVSRAAHSTIVRWRLLGADGALEVRPLVAARRGDELSDPSRFRGEARCTGRSLEYAPRAGVPPLALSFVQAEWTPGPDIYRSTIHPRDHDRAGGDREDLLGPGVLRLPLVRDRWVALVCGTGRMDAGTVPELVAAELRRREAVAARASRFTGDDVPAHLPARLALAADAWVVRQRGGRAITAGFPALHAQGDAALAALPGLCVATGQVREAAAVLHAFLRHDLARGGSAVGIPTLLRYVLAAAAVVDQGVAARELWPGVLRALDTCATRAGSDGFHGPAAPELNELWYAALLRARAFARDHPAAVRFESIADRLRETAAGFAEARGSEFPAVPSVAGPMLLDASRLAAAVAACEGEEGGAAAVLPAARLDDYARAAVRLYGDAAGPRLCRVLDRAAGIVEGRGLGQVPEYLGDGPDEAYAVADSRAVAAVISVCALVASRAHAVGVADGRTPGYIARPWKP